jgi:hypothetical protein
MCGAVRRIVSLGAPTHLRNGCCDWVEVGWRLKWVPPCGAECVLGIHWFSEMAINGVKQDGIFGAFPCAKIDGNFYRWRTVNIDGTDDWNLRVSCSGPAFQTLDTIPNFGHTTGMPMAETGRRGGTATGMSDRQIDLHWESATDVWKSWTDPDCWLDDASNWQGHPQSSGNDYYTEGGPSNC